MYVLFSSLDSIMQKNGRQICSRKADPLTRAHNGAAEHVDETAALFWDPLLANLCLMMFPIQPQEVA